MASPTPSACPLLEALRQSTRSLHRELEENPRMRQLITPELTLEAYGEILIRYHALFASYENQLKRYSSEWEHFAYDPLSRAKLPRIEQDLQALNLETRLPRDVLRGQQLHFDSFPAIVGTLYVTEGSSLGGQVISRQLKQHLGLTADNGAAYFNGYGTATRENWGAFRTFLESYARERTDFAPVVEAAKHAFKTFDQTMA